MTFIKDPLNATTPREIIEYSQDLEDRVDGGFEDLIQEVTVQLAQKAEQTEVNATNLRIDNLVIPISPENVNIEVTDAHNSIVKNKNFASLKDRLEESEDDLVQHKLDYAEKMANKVDKLKMINIIKNGKFLDSDADGVGDYWIKGNNLTGLNISDNTQYFIGGGRQNLSVANWFYQNVFEVGKKYYITFKAKRTTPSDDWFYVSNGYDLGQSFKLATNFATYDYIFTPTRTELTFSATLNARMGITEILVFNLTDFYGVGLEPDIDGARLLFENESYLESEKIISLEEMYISLKNLTKSFQDLLIEENTTWEVN